MNGNTAKKIEVQAENTALKMSNMQIRKSGISRILHGHSVYLNCNWSRGALLPINAGSGGLLSLLLITLLAYPVMYYSHRALAKMIYASNSADEGSQVQLESISEIKRVSFLTSYISVQFIQSY